MTFAQKLREARTAAGLTQKELAFRSHLALRTIANYELGEHLPKKEETYEALAGALGVTPESLKDDNSDFVIRDEKKYRGKGHKQAEELVRSFRVAAAGGELDDDDLEFIKDAVMQTYRDAKRYNQRFAGRKEQDDHASDGTGETI